MPGTEPADSREARRDRRRWLAGIALITACSWGRWLATGSLKVDASYPAEALGMLLFAGLVGGWASLVVGWSGMLVRPPAAPRRLAFSGLALAALMLPMISNDVFSLLAYGSLAARGQDVYTTAAHLPESPWFGWIGQHWTGAVCVYGPTTLASLLPSALGGSDPWLALLALRVAWLVPLVFVMELSFRRLRDRPSFHAMLWLNPLWLLEGPGQMHADLLGVTAVVAGIALAAGGRTAGSLAAYAFALLGKYSFAFAGPWFWLTGAATARARARRGALLLAIVALAAVVSFAPFWRGAATVLEPVRALGGMNPGGSLTEVVGTIVHVLRGGGVPHADAPVQAALELDRAANATTWFVVSLVLRVVTLAVAARLLLGMLRPPHDEGRIALGTGALVVAVITLASHRFQAWYLVAALPFFGLCCTLAWRRWWIAIVAVSVTPEFVYVLPRTAVVLPVWVAASTFVTVALFLAWFRARYWSLYAEPAAAPTVTPVAPAPAPPGATAPGAR